jgi:hypothetical protein
VARRAAKTKIFITLHQTLNQSLHSGWREWPGAPPKTEAVLLAFTTKHSTITHSLLFSVFSFFSFFFFFNHRRDKGVARVARRAAKTEADAAAAAKAATTVQVSLPYKTLGNNNDGDDDGNVSNGGGGGDDVDGGVGHITTRVTKSGIPILSSTLVEAAAVHSDLLADVDAARAR